MADFRALWAEYTTSTPPTKPSKERDNGAIDEAISYIISDSEDDDELTDEYDRWRKLEPKWTSKQHNSPNVDGNPIKYWWPFSARHEARTTSKPHTQRHIMQQFIGSSNESAEIYDHARNDKPQDKTFGIATQFLGTQAIDKATHALSSRRS
ncbi:hypothetical protein A1F94_003778 [Pyrenophora tritici-repentis]|nr:hypothetical protein A1F94_003778 [Pyrenophora tritici-repentis]